MFELNVSLYFDKKMKKLIKNNHAIEDDIIECLIALKNDPRDPRLESHKVDTRIFGKKWSSTVTGNIRIIWDYSSVKVNILEILDIGGHNGKNKVYNTSSN